MKDGPVLKDIIDIEEFQKIQDDIACSTGIAIITVDYNGRPITKHSMCTGFCKIMREENDSRELCEKCDSIGGQESARIGLPYVYKCYNGLIDFAVPIILDGQYIGALMAGQVFTEESKSLELKKIILGKSNTKYDEKLMIEYKKLCVIPYKRIKSIGKMMFHISNYIVSQAALKRLQQELNEENIKFINSKRSQIELEKELKDAQLKALQSQINPHFLFNTLNSISALSLIEGAPRIQEVVCNLSAMLRYTLKKANEMSQLGDEINYVISYLNLQKIRFDSRLDFNIHIDEKFKDIEVPSMIIQPFVENSIIHGIELKEEGGLIEVKAYESEKNLIISIEDNGVGINKDKLEIINKKGKDYDESSFNKSGISNVKKRLDYCYGTMHSIDIVSERNEGTQVKITIFKHTY
ncbi:sensor histidine kinase [Clostridium arbusti]|uniref:sensor histidine kinase n=1 Tax=Clostridium arbusti TaxID=1137848 RepID=UPI0002883CF4|nr:PocR ligand-binding domain-containing protein [Clostridium arbusti]